MPSITDLTALTTPATGDTLVIVDVSEALPANQTKKITLNNLFEWQAFTPTYGGFSSNPSGTTRYLRIGNLVIYNVHLNTVGTSNATTFTISAPFEATASTMTAIGFYVDGGTNVFGQGYATILTGESTVKLATSGGTSAWTTSGNKAARFQIVYEV